MFQRIFLPTLLLIGLTQMAAAQKAMDCSLLAGRHPAAFEKTTSPVVRRQFQSRIDIRFHKASPAGRKPPGENHHEKQARRDLLQDFLKAENKQ